MKAELTGRTFGRWTVVSLASRRSGTKRYWNCRCECGREKAVLAGSLRRGKSTSCGCSRRGRTHPQFIDVTGKRFGMLIALRTTRNRRGELVWVCVCDCGLESEVNGTRLLRGGTKSCGCQQGIGNRKASGCAAFNSYVAQYVFSARKRGIAWKLTDNQARELGRSNCHYCGVEPEASVSKSKAMNGDFVHNGIDRVDSTGDYEIDNCVSACKICNYAKRDMHIDQFNAYINRLVAYKNGARKKSGPVSRPRAGGS